MTYVERKIHKLIWIILVIITPIFLVFAATSIKEPFITDTDLKVSNSNKGKIIIQNDQLDVYKISDKQLQVIVKTPIKSASSSVYGVTTTKKETFLGTIDKKGIYQFNINSNYSSLKIVDNIKKTNLFNIQL